MLLHSCLDALVAQVMTREASRFAERLLTKARAGGHD